MFMTSVSVVSYQSCNFEVLNLTRVGQKTGRIGTFTGLTAAISLQEFATWLPALGIFKLERAPVEANPEDDV